MMLIKRWYLIYLVTGFIALLAYSPITYANTAQMHETLSRIKAILSQINPLINLAKQQQDPNVRIQFQFEHLRQDVSKIQQGILAAINRVSIQPRVVKPLSGDYLSNAQIKMNHDPNENPNKDDSP